MSNPFSFLVDNAIRAAEARGEFANLPGSGKPLPPIDQPKDAVMNRILRESKAKPPLVIFNQKIAASHAHLRTLSDPDERKAEMRKLADLQTRLAIEQEACRRYG